MTNHVLSVWCLFSTGVEVFHLDDPVSVKYCLVFFFLLLGCNFHGHTAHTVVYTVAVAAAVFSLEASTRCLKTPLTSIKRNPGKVWARLIKSKSTAVTPHITFIYSRYLLFLFINYYFITLLIYISLDWFFTAALNTLHFNIVWVHTLFAFLMVCFLFYVLYSYFILLVSGMASMLILYLCGFLPFTANLHSYLCKCNFYEKSVFVRQESKFCNDFYQHKPH